jgi:flagellar biosynthesis protein FlhB
MSEDKTEPATWKRRKKARDQGQVARSAELVASAIMLCVLWSVPALAPGLARNASDFCTSAFAAAGQGPMGPESLGAVTINGLRCVMLIAGPVLGMVFVAALVSNVAQVGFQFSPGLIAPKFSKLNPLQGLKRMVSPKSLVELLKSALKVAIVAISGWNFLTGHWETIFNLSSTDATGIAPAIGGLAYGMTLQMVGTLAIVAALDYAYQRWNFERELKMTKQEVRDEHKESEGNPEVKGAIRRKMRQISRRRMLADVAKASVVITNPTHFAVALKYEMGGGAPKVVAKGQDLIALRIRQVAEENKVPTVENPPLARALYKLAEIGDEIPQSLYRAVAEILALVWRLDARSRR